MPRVLRPLLRVYADETGDRGCGGRSSDYFAFAAVLVSDEDDGDLRAAVSRLRRDLSVPMGKHLHWKDHVKTFRRRQHVAHVLGSTPRLMVVYTLVEKSAIPASALMRSDQAVFYNYAVGITLERVLFAARDWPGGSRDALVRFGHVRGFRHQTTADYIKHRMTLPDPYREPWHLLRGNLHFDGPAAWDGLQAADPYAGMLSAALRRDEFPLAQHHS